jgi:hypothetical protein
LASWADDALGVGVEQPLAMDDSNDKDCIALYPIDEPVTVDESLSDSFVVEFRDDSSCGRETLQVAGGIDDFFSDGARISGLVTVDVVSDGINVVERFGRPSYSVVHLASRCSACSCESAP